MDLYFLELSQMLDNHPIMSAKKVCKIKYLQVLEYFINKYSLDKTWSSSMLNLYIEKMGIDKSDMISADNLKINKIISLFRVPFKFFSYRFCLISDIILMVAYDDRQNGEKAFNELISVYSSRYYKKMSEVFELIYNKDDLAQQITGAKYFDVFQEYWNKNKKFLKSYTKKVIVTANMSAGKSTLLNAIVGKKVNRTKNDACTAKIHYILNKAFEDGLSYEYDYNLELNADYNTLMDDNENNLTDSIYVGTYFRTLNKADRRLWLIDTPGVNSYSNHEHREVTEKAINNISADLMIYLLNGENIGTDDDRNHLMFIKKIYTGKIIFVINKVDSFKKEDSVEGTIKAVKTDLESIGFENPFVVPVSAYSAYLSKISIFDNNLDEDEKYEIERLSRKLKKPEYQFDTYYPEDVQNRVNIENKNENYQLLKNSGILQLENIIYSEV